MITNQQFDAYQDQGYILVENVIEPAMLAQIKEVMNQIIEGARGKIQHDDVYDLEPAHTPDQPRVRRIKKPHVVHPLFNQVVRSEKMVSVLTRLLGPDVRLHGSKLNLKSPRYGSPVEWHQDWAFYPHTNDDILAIGVMLDDVLPENGPMVVIPGSHTGPTYDHHAEGRFCGAMNAPAVDLDFSTAVAVTGPAGSCSFHHVRLVHGSAQNTSDRPRSLLLYEATAADAWPLVNWTNLDEFNARMICGKPTLEPRVKNAPIRMPYPPALNQGSIYENQTAVGRRFFEVKAA